MFNKELAFLKKDFLMESSYSVNFLLKVFWIFISVLSYFFINKLFGSRMVPYLETFGVDYFSYVLLSMALFGYIGVGLGSFSERLNSEQQQGTLESILLTPTKISTILISLTIWNLILATVDLIVYIVLAIFLFKISFANINIVSALAILFLTAISFSALGIISASFIMVFKRGNPLSFVVSSLEGLIGGVYFPVTVLPWCLQFLAQFFPITYAIRGIELAVYKGYSPFQLSKEIGFLLFFSIFLFPLSITLFKRSLKRARSEGSLSQY